MLNFIHSIILRNKIIISIKFDFQSILYTFAKTSFDELDGKKAKERSSSTSGSSNLSLSFKKGLVIGLFGTDSERIFRGM